MKASGILLVFLFHDVASIKTENFEDNCDQTIDVSSMNSVRLKLDEYSSLNSYDIYSYYTLSRSCRISVKTSSDGRIMFYFKSFNVGSSSYCNSYNDYGLRVRDVSDESDLDETLCGILTSSKVYQTTGNYLQLKHVTRSSTSSSDEFDMVITSYHTGNCKYNEYSCSNNRCISDSLTCNGYNPCGDHSDCNNVIAVGVIVGAVVGSILLVVCLIVSVICCCRRRRLTNVRPPVNQPVSAITVPTVMRYEYPPPQPGPQQYPIPQQYPVQQYPLHPIGQVPNAKKY